MLLRAERETQVRLGISSYTYGWAVGVPGYPPPRALNPQGLLNKAVELGVHVVQFADNLPLDWLSDGELRALAKQASQYRIEIELGAQGITPNCLRKQLLVAERLGVSLLRLVMDTASIQPTAEEVVQTLGKLMPEFQRAGVRLAIENHDGFKAAALLEILDRLNNPCAGICLDTANSFGCSEGPDVVLETLGPRVFNLHLKDYIVRRLPHLKGFLIQGCPAGQGQLDIPRLLQRLRQMGRDPNVILELWPPPQATVLQTITNEQSWAAKSVDCLRRYIAE